MVIMQRNYKLEYYANLRAELLSILSGVDNASESLWWDDTTPNYITKRKLQNIFKKYVSLAKLFGVYLITLHADCGGPQHNKQYAIESDTFSKDWEFKDSGYIWGSDVFRDPLFCRCPCAENNGPTEHWVVKQFVYFVGYEEENCRVVDNILCDIYSAIENAENRKPRSGIREYLLRAIIRTNDAILPITVDEYLKQQDVDQTSFLELS